MTGRLHIDWTSCDGAGLCIELLPELLERDPWGYPIPRAEATASGGRDVTVPAVLDEHARHAVRTCPRLALRLQDQGAQVPKEVQPRSGKPAASATLADA